MELTNEDVAKFAGGTYDVITPDREFDWMRGDIKTATIEDGDEGAPALCVQGENSYRVTVTGDWQALNVDSYPFRLNRGPYEWDEDGRLVMRDYLYNFVIVITPPGCELKDTYTTQGVGYDPDGNLAQYAVTYSNTPDDTGSFVSNEFVKNL